MATNLKWGLRWGAYYGGIYGLLMLLLILFSDARPAPVREWSDWVFLVVYVSLCLAISAVVGLLRPLASTWGGTAAIGLIVGFLIGLSLGGLLMGTDFRNPGYVFVVSISIFGGVLGSLAIRFSHRQHR